MGISYTPIFLSDPANFYFYLYLYLYLYLFLYLFIYIYIYLYLFIYLYFYFNLYLANFELDPANFYTSPGLAWKACLKHTGIKLELLTDPDMLLMFEQGSEVELLKQFVNAHKQIINIWEIDSIPVRIPLIFSA